MTSYCAIVISGNKKKEVTSVFSNFCQPNSFSQKVLSLRAELFLGETRPSQTLFPGITTIMVAFQV